LELITYIKKPYCYKKLTQELESVFKETGFQDKKSINLKYRLQDNKKYKSKIQSLRTIKSLIDI
jgi:hypothetical protein